MKWLRFSPSKTVRSVLERFRGDDSGAVAILFGIAALPVMLGVGAAIDYSSVVQTQSKLQAAADAGALAAAQNSSGTQSQRQSVAESISLGTLGALATKINATATESEPASGQYKVTIAAAVPTAVMKLAGIDAIRVVASSVAGTVSGQTTTTTTTTTSAANVCILVLAKSTTQAFLGNSGATINSPKCEVDVASTAAPAAILNSAVKFTLNEFCVAGTSIINNGATVTNGSTSVLKTGCAVASDPFAGKLPTVSVGACTVSNQTYSGAVTLSPGVYCGSFNFNGTGSLTLNPGLYIFKGASWNLNSGWTMTGSGVTLYFADTSYMQFNGTAAVNLSAPTSGTYANILMYEAAGLSTSSFTINGGSATPDCLTGLIYLPSRNLTFNSGASVNAAAITMVVNTLIMDGVTWNLTASAFPIPSASSTVTTTQTTTVTSPSSVRLIQ